MLVSNLMDRLQPGMLYQRSEAVTRYGESPKIIAVTGVVLDHILTANDGDDVILVKVIEFSIRDTYSTYFVDGGTPRLLQPTDDLIMLSMSFPDIVEATRSCRQLVDKQVSAARDAADKASRVLNGIGFFESAIHRAERDAIEVGDKATIAAVQNLEAAGIGFDIITMPPAVQEYLDEEKS